jgi:hypothetical protein
MPEDGQVMLGPPEPEQVLDPSLVASEVGRRLGDLERCYAARLAEDPTLGGEILMHWGVGPDGKTAEACITEDTVEDDAIRVCVNQLVASVSFPGPLAGPVAVTLPFVFTAPPMTADRRPTDRTRPPPR